MSKIIKIGGQIILWITGVTIGLLLLVFLLIRVPFVQQYVIQQLVGYLETSIKTPVSIQKVEMNLPKTLVLEGVYFEDQQGDTLLSGDTLRVDLNFFKLFSNTLEISNLDLRGITAHVSRSLPDSRFNFDYIIEAFVDTTENSPEDRSASGMAFSMKAINLDRIQLQYQDAVIGTSLAFSLEHLDTKIETFDLDRMHFDISEVRIQGVDTDVEQWAVVQASDSMEADTEPQEETFALPKVQVGNMQLGDIQVHYKDRSAHLQADVSFAHLFAELKQLDLESEKLQFGKLELQDHYSQIRMGASQTMEHPQEDPTGGDTTTINWEVQAEQVRLSNNHIRYDDSTQALLPRGMDYAHLDMQDVYLDLQHFYFTMDSIAGSLSQFSMQEKSGLRVQDLRTDFQYTSTGVVLENLLLETPHTRLQHDIRLTYPSLESLSTDLASIGIQGELQESYLGMEDVEILMPELFEMPELQGLKGARFYLDTRVSGLLGNLSIPKLTLRTMDDTFLEASGQIKGLPDVERIFADLQLTELRSTQGDLSRLIAAELLPEGISLPDKIKLNGVFTGGMQAFKTRMQLHSTLGNARVSGMYAARGDTLYQGNLLVEDFQLDRWMGDTTLGILSVEARIKGRGLDPKTVEGEAEGRLIAAGYNGYTYKDIHFDAHAAAGNLQASLKGTDPNLSLSMNAQADLNGIYPQVQAELNLDTLDLYALNFMEEPFRYRGKVEADFSSADPDFLNGRLHVLRSEIAYNGAKYQLDSLNVYARNADSLQVIYLQSEPLRAHMIGDYQLSQLPMAMQDVLGSYYSPLRPDTIEAYRDQSFEFSASFQRSPLVQELVPELTEMEPVTLDGTFQSADRMINMRLGAHHVLYDGTRIDTLSLDVNSVDSTLYYAGGIKRIEVSDINLINTLLSGTIHDNVLEAGLWIKDAKDREQYHIGAELFAEDQDYRLSIKPDGLMLNYAQWDVDPGNALYFGENGILAQTFNLEHEGQEMHLNSRDTVKNAPLDLEFKDFRIETLTKFIESSTLKLGGALQGDVQVDRLSSSPVFVSDLSIDQFYFNQDTIGDILLKVDNQQANTYAAELGVVGQGNDVQLKGVYHAPLQGVPNFDMLLDIQNLNMSTLEAFSFGSIRKSTGAIQGKLAIKGTTEEPNIQGDLLFDQAETTISMLNAHFGMDQQKINFNRSGMRFNQFQIKDEAGNTAMLNGNIRTSNYLDYAFNLGITARNLQVLHSTSKDNDLFYGDLFLDTDLKITGDMENPKVNGTLRVNPETDMTVLVPDDQPGLVEREGIVEFVDLSDSTNRQIQTSVEALRTRTVPGMDVSLNIDVDPEAAFTVIIDPGTGDALHAKGSAELTAGIDPGGNISLAGTYEVTEGSYRMSFNMINRRFDFQKGSLITWSGDPYQADLDITAVYQVDAPPLDLVEHQLSGQNTTLFKEKIPFNVNLFIKGEMMKPELAFGIGMDSEQAQVSQDVSSLVETRLLQLQEDESELNKQVFALIVLGRFVAENPFASLAGANVGSMARESVSKILSAQLNRLAGDLIAGVELNFDLESTDDYSTGQQQSRTDLNVGVSKQLFNDRLKVTVGSNFGLEGANQPGRQATNIAGDISMDYKLSKDGRYLLRAYRQNKYEVTLQGQVVETGLGFVISMDYNEFKELLMNARQLEAHQQAEEARKEKIYRRQGRERRFRRGRRPRNTPVDAEKGVVEYNQEKRTNEK